MDATSGQPTVAETLARMDEGWADFRERVQSIPSQVLEEHIATGSWTLKQMLAHVATWHQLTIERLSGLIETGEPQRTPDDEDVINARAARAAAGRTTGEIILDIEHTYRQLRRKVARLTDDQLAAHDAWAAAVIAGNSYGHYREHLADLGPRQNG
ncbi:MAG TPA: DinB family protein [Candidatus Limnocylindria bacterium]|nr:DinB family protein [Candidatus Limnocylindria bacterium]